MLIKFQNEWMKSGEVFIFFTLSILGVEFEIEIVDFICQIFFRQSKFSTIFCFWNPILKGYFSVWIFGRPFFSESELLSLIFPPLKALIPSILLVALWLFIALCVVSINCPEAQTKKSQWGFENWRRRCFCWFSSSRWRVSSWWCRSREKVGLNCVIEIWHHAM